MAQKTAKNYQIKLDYFYVSMVILSVIFIQKSIMKKSLLSLPLVLGLGLALTACSQNGEAKSQSQSKASPSNTVSKSTSGQHQEVHDALQANLVRSGITAEVVNVTPIDMPDMYLAQISGMPPVFTDKTGTYIFQGDLIKLGTMPAVSLGDEAQASVAKSMLADVPKSEMIIFPAKGATKAVVYVFSDPTCHYCQILHKEINQTNAQGIEVRYLAWPRSEQMVSLTESVWCSADRNTALTDAKKGKSIPPKTCDNPVRRHMELGFALGVSGTPAVFTESGKQIGGYLPSSELAKVAIENK